MWYLKHYVDDGSVVKYILWINNVSVFVAVHIEKIVLKGISRTKADREYNFEVSSVCEIMLRKQAYYKYGHFHLVAGAYMQIEVDNLSEADLNSCETCSCYLKDFA